MKMNITATDFRSICRRIECSYCPFRLECDTYGNTTWRPPYTWTDEECMEIDSNIMGVSGVFGKGMLN